MALEQGDLSAAAWESRGRMQKYGRKYKLLLEKSFTQLNGHFRPAGVGVPVVTTAGSGRSREKSKLNYSSARASERASRGCNQIKPTGSTTFIYRRKSRDSCFQTGNERPDQLRNRTRYTRTSMGFRPRRPQIYSEHTSPEHHKLRLVRCMCLRKRF